MPKRTFLLLSALHQLFFTQIQSKRWLLYLLLVFTRATIPLLLLVLLKPLLDVLLVSSGTSSLLAVQNQIYIYAGIIFLLILSGSMLGLLQQKTRMQLGSELDGMIQEQVLLRVSRLPVEEMANSYMQDMLFRLRQQGSQRIMNLISQSGNISYALTGLFLMGILLSFYLWFLPLALLLAILPLVFLRQYKTQSSYSFNKNQTTQWRYLQSLHRILSSVRNSAEVRFFELENYFLPRWKELHHRLHSERLQQFRYWMKREIVWLVFPVAVVFLLLHTAIKETVSGSLSTGELGVIIAGMYRSVMFLYSLADSWERLGEESRFLHELNSFLSNPVPIPISTLPMPEAHTLEIQKLGYNYPDSRFPVLHDLDLALKKGEIVLLTGRNGSGKSTLIRLLAGLYPLQQGEIRYGNLIIKGTSTFKGEQSVQIETQKKLSRKMSVFFQDSFVYPATFFENIALGDLRRNDPSFLKSIVEDLGLNECFKKFPAGMDQMAGKLFPQGRELSTGEYQKLSLARTLYRDADILLFDEPTSSLDPESTEKFMRLLQKIKVEKIILIVTQDKDLANFADRCLSLSNGQIQIQNN